MPRNDRARLDCRALPYLQPAAVPAAPADMASAFLTGGAQSPARIAVEARSDLSFVIETVVRLRDAGARHPEGAALAVLTHPTVAARRNLPDGGSLIVQSVVFEREPDDFDLQVTAWLRAKPGKPGSVAIENLQCQPVDLDDHSDRCLLVASVEGWSAEFPLPATFKFPEPLPLRPWAWLGDPSHVGLRDTPAHWRDLVKRTGAVHGVSPLVADTAQRARSWKLEDRIEHAILVRGTKWAADFPPATASKDIEVHQIGVLAGTFQQTLEELRALLLDEALAANAPASSSRDLEPGEIVYHRKVGASSKFDTFDAGSTEPCAHGADAFVGWTGDKAVKGMNRRYDNFTAEMLIHCGKFPNCGMYGVDAARGGVKAKR